MGGSIRVTIDSNLNMICGFSQKDPVWNSNYDHHYNWCIRAKASQELLESSLGLRKESLDKCMLDKHPSVVLQDEDKDNLDDRVEQRIAERYSPIIYHSSAETNFPTNVDWFLTKTSLMFYDDGCEPDKHLLIKLSPSQRDLLSYVQSEGCDNYKIPVFSNRIRSKNKQYTFYLKDVHEQWRKGSLDTRYWTTYFHAFPNDIGGVTIQYWRFYAYNDAANNHGGDWEGIFLVLDKEEKPTKIGFFGHTTISVENPSSLE